MRQSCPVLPGPPNAIARSDLQRWHHGAYRMAAVEAELCAVRQQHRTSLSCKRAAVQVAVHEPRGAGCDTSVEVAFLLRLGPAEVAWVVDCLQVRHLENQPNLVA